MSGPVAGRGVRPATTSAGLPRAVAAALATPGPGVAGRVRSGDMRWATVTWGRPSDPPLLLVHGVTSNARVWWRVGPALAAAGRRVIAVDMPGHGRTAGWKGRHRFAETAEDVAAFVRAAGLDRPDLAVVGHSWGAVVTAHLPAAGLRPAVLVLLDPPALTLDQLEALTRDPTERPYATVAEAAAVVRRVNPTWSDGDVEAKARALTEFDPDAVLAVILENGDFDAGMAGLRHPDAAGVPVWLIRGEWATGGMIPESTVPQIERQLGREHVITIPLAPHSPQRTHPEATVRAILRALGGLGAG